VSTQRLQGWLDSVGKLGAAIGTLVTLLLVMGYAALSAQINAFGFQGTLLGLKPELSVQYFVYAFELLYYVFLASAVTSVAVMAPGLAVAWPIRRLLRGTSGPCRAPLWLDVALAALGMVALIKLVPLAAGSLSVPSPLGSNPSPSRCLALGPSWLRMPLLGLLCLSALLLGAAIRVLWQRLQRRRGRWFALAGLVASAAGLIVALPSIPILYGKLFMPDDYPWVSLRATAAPAAGGASVAEGWLVVATPDAFGLWLAPHQADGPPRLGAFGRSAVSTIEIEPERRQSLAQLVAPDLRALCDQTETTTMLTKPLLPAFVVLVIGAGLALARAETTPVRSQSAAQDTSSIAVEQWLGFFAAAKTELDELLRIVETLPRSFRGDDDEPSSAADGETAGDIWLFDLTTNSSQRLTTDGGYRSPQGSRNGQWICFLRHGHLGIMRRDGGARQSFEDAGPYMHLLGCRMDTGEALLADAEGRIFLLSLADGGARQIVPTLDDREPMDMDRLIDLSRLSPDGRQVYVRSGEGVWRLLVNRRDYLEPRMLLSSNQAIAEPSWATSGAEVLFVMGDD